MSRRFGFALVALCGGAGFGLVLGGAAPATAAGPDHGGPDWPCPQRKVVKLGAQDLQWSGADPDTIKGWREDAAVSSLVKQVTSRRVPLADAVEAIKSFAEKTPADARKDKLTALFAGVFTLVNEERVSVINGIERYNRRQRSRAQEIQSEGAQLNELERKAKTDPKLQPEYEKALELYEWNTRVFEERRQNMPLACEIPPAIDGRTFDLVRAIQTHMPQS
jgi:hypothetical protein